MIIDTLRTRRFALLEDNLDENLLPLVLDAALHVGSDVKIAVLCYEQPATVWRKVLNRVQAQYYDNNVEMIANIDSNLMLIIDSFNQMSLQLGMQRSYEHLRNLMRNPKVVKIVTIFHADCTQKCSKILHHLEHMAHLTLITQRSPDENKLRVSMNNKRGGKLIKTTEDIWYDGENECLRWSPVSSQQLKREEPEEVSPHTLTTFKISLEDKEKLARNELELPYLKKSETGKVYYEHDAADDWDDEDPDEDLDI